VTDVEKSKGPSEADVLAPATGPLVFISHDARDSELAEAFGKLLKSVSAGMIKTFRSSDKKGQRRHRFRRRVVQATHVNAAIDL
jgi:hypothetical protein